MLNYYKDFSDYEYYMKSPIPEVKNIGWLDKKHEFTTGRVDTSFLNKLELLILKSDDNECNILVNELRGSYKCPICGKHREQIVEGNNKFTLGSAELWIPDYRENDHYFATFGLIVHYIKEHDYKPPKEFIDSVMFLDETSEFNAQEVRDQFSERAYLEGKNK